MVLNEKDSSRRAKSLGMETKKLILIIDDEVSFVELMRFFLENAGFRVISASTPDEGIEKVRLKPDLILLDLTMPEMNGHEVCKRLKENELSLPIPIIMLTSQDRTLDKVEAFNLGVADYIGKDFPFEEILSRIKNVLREVSPEITTLARQERNKKILELRKIIDEKNIRTLFQPIVHLSNRSPFGYEALTRGPAMSFLENALDLFTLASEENMFSELNKLCLSLAAKRAVFIRENQFLFLNTDPLFLGEDYVKHLDFLNGSTLRPQQVCIEITERTCIKNYVKLSTDLNYFKSRGVKVAIDDVGEGYSSLKAIAELKPEFIKIDMGLVRNVNADEVKKTLIQVITDFAKKMHSHLIAEGIETEEEYKALLALGVEYGQGYLFAKPAEHIQTIPAEN